MDISFLPTLNACFNTASATCLVLGYWAIRRKQIIKHKIFMISALVMSTFFISGYLFYHYHHGSTRFLHQGIIRTVYFTILISHTVLAMVIVPLIFMTFKRAFQGQISRHKTMARITLPLWLYVSVTGVAIYLMLYHF